jgi:hypothetical protein
MQAEDQCFDTQVAGTQGSDTVQLWTKSAAKTPIIITFHDLHEEARASQCRTSGIGK